jgi:hypothetical protein
LGGDITTGKLYKLDNETRDRFKFQLKTHSDSKESQSLFVEQFIKEEVERMISIQRRGSGGLIRTTPISIPFPSEGMSLPLSENKKGKLELERNLRSERGTNRDTINNYRSKLREYMTQSKFALF